MWPSVLMFLITHSPAAGAMWNVIALLNMMPSSYVSNAHCTLLPSIVPTAENTSTTCAVSVVSFTSVRTLGISEDSMRVSKLVVL